jgi:branched-chain amino acid transport system ATP-binding protein
VVIEAYLGKEGWREPCLKVENLRVSYGKIKALHGMIFMWTKAKSCIIGANGAGKSTTLRAISRLVPVSEGTPA